MIGTYTIGSVPIAGAPQAAETGGLVTASCFDGHVKDLVWNGETTSLIFNGTIQTDCNTFSTDNC